MYSNIRNRDFLPELTFSASRSSGAGGQNVNKVNTKVELRFDIASSSILTEEEKNRLLTKLAKRLTQEGILIIVSQTERTQLKNKAQCLMKFYELLESALTVQKKRKQTKPTLASKAKKMENKKRQSERKASRRSIEY
ncbi:alternative ribosome rescue aminoacyl-tRNA hydrolase ArfB [Acetobacteroides hydrogenigenes]|uniref:Ribosome-associated protein n=1 Tax=Acetobacteroides hydrogenigenes TaxID=979970 RepID=A0A4R2EFS9_9BACT|nr:alternative ribosome rescue aminoacyl-tRNA hydrolase ArfB [Acetobacteroides hydrogenigenes]TCN62929.1 ribosome-associated protein [Acetobacteroides hydrogenigenes]